MWHFVSGKTTMVVTSNGICSDMGCTSILTLAACEAAANIVGWPDILASANSALYEDLRPGGCHLRGDSRLWYNSNTSSSVAAGENVGGSTEALVCECPAEIAYEIQHNVEVSASVSGITESQVLSTSDPMADSVGVSREKVNVTSYNKSRRRIEHEEDETGSWDIKYNVQAKSKDVAEGIENRVSSEGFANDLASSISTELNVNAIVSNVVAEVVEVPADECGVPNGDGSSCADECGVPNGNGSSCADDCGVPNGDNSSCADDCGVPNGDNSTCADAC